MSLSESVQIREPLRSLRELQASLHAEPVHAATDDLIVVSAATRRVAFAYERFRNILEPDEEDILRRKAIWRMLDRRMEEDRSPLVIARAILQELIRAHYIKPVPESYALTVARHIERAKQTVGHFDEETSNFLVMMFAVSIDRELYPRRLEESFVQFMYHDTYVRSAWAGDLLNHEDRAAQLYIACHRTLFASDDYEIMYHFFVNRFPFWHKAEFKEKELTTIIRDLPELYQGLNTMMSHPARDRLYRLIRPISVPYRVLWDMLQQNKEDIWQSEQTFEQEAREATVARSRHIEQRMGRRAWHGVLFLFFTKTVFAFLIELPYELFLLGKIHYLGLAANTLFHPLVLFVSSMTTRMPGASNTEKIIDQMKRIALGKGELQTIVLDSPRQYGAATWTLFGLFYTALFMLIFWRLFILLDRLDFTLLGMLIFVMFLGLVSFLATRIRRSVDDIRVIPRREGAFSLFMSFVSLPILELGRWLSSHIRQLNIILFIMDLVLEAPFKLLIDVTEEWFAFVKDRKEEIM